MAGLYAVQRSGERLGFVRQAGSGAGSRNPLPNGSPFRLASKGNQAERPLLHPNDQPPPGAPCSDEGAVGGTVGEGVQKESRIVGHNDFVLQAGVYPASVTPFDEKGKVNLAATARLLAWFEAAGCKGAVLAGTNGEGPSLSAIEKRDLIRDAMSLRGRLEIILGIATSSLEEAVWLCRQASTAGAIAALVMPPSYFREATEEGLTEWFRALMNRTEIPILVYNFPQRTGVTVSAQMLSSLSDHPNFAGAKDSSGDADNLAAYASAIGGKGLYVGNETLLLHALRAGWTGTISGASNVMPYPLARVIADWTGNDRESAEAKFDLCRPAIEALRGQPQPATNKALLKRIGVLPSAEVRLPLSARTDVEELFAQLEQILGPLAMHGRMPQLAEARP